MAPPVLDPDHLFGRAALLDRLHATWAAGARWITLIGPPGAGKTRVARAMGGCFVDLTAATHRVQVVRALAASLAVPLDDGDEAAALQRVGRALLAVERPVVLDNLEQLVAVMPALIGQLDDPGLRWLATSRQPVGVPGEVLVTVEGLPIESAMALFRARAWRVGQQIPTGPALARLVDTLDGLPLALELAAARTTTCSIAELQAAIPRDPGLLDRPERSLRAALAVSWTRLDALSRAALRALAIFRTPMAVDAAAAVLDAPAAKAMDLIEGLRLAGWLTVEPGTPTRFRLYLGVRAFAADQGLDDAAQRRYVCWHGAEGERLWRALRGPAPVQALDALAALAADLEHARDLGHRLGLIEPAARAALALHDLTCDRGPWHAGTQALDDALARLDGRAPVKLRVELLGARSLTRALRGAYGPAAADIEAALAHAEAADDPALIAWALGGLSPVRRFQGHLVEAERLARAELALAEAHDLLREQARARFNLAGALALQSRIAEACDLWRAARAAARVAGDVRLAAICLANLALMAVREAQVGAAEALLAEAVGEFERVEMPVMLAKLHRDQVALAQLQGDADRALALVDAGARLAGRMHDVELAVDMAVARATLGGDPGLWAAARALAARHDLLARVEQARPDAAVDGFEGADGWVDLQQRPVLRRVFAALQRHAGPMSVPALIDAAWPDERILPDAAASRVYTAIRALRRLGAPIVTTPGEGYSVLP